MKYNKKIIHVLCLVCAMFLSLISYLVYFELFLSEDTIKNSYNRRLFERENEILRGDITDINGVVLAKSEFQDGRQKRVYPFSNLYAHVIGYNSKTYGKSQLELRYNDYLLGLDSLSAVASITDIFKNEEKKGADLRLTIDHNLQKKAYNLMGNNNGALVAIDPQTGAVLALVSKPDFNPNEDVLVNSWPDMADSESAPFLARATMGLYPPGSTYKTIISAYALENNMDEEIEDKGSINIGGKVFSNSNKKSYGKIGLKKAFSVSSNVYFAILAEKIGEEGIKEISKNFLIGEEIPFDLKVEKSRFNYGKMEAVDLASVGIGQGKLMVTPFQMALVAASVANDGILMRPYLLESATLKNGFTLYNARPTVLKTVMDKAVAGKLCDLMRDVIQNGTGKSAKIAGLDVYGKTGTAENEQKKDHAWFIGFCDNGSKKIAVCVILEYNKKSGGEVCAPIAREFFKEWDKYY
ncbi:MAG: peptidoglycan glycosyltransferase [Clostridiaceae bacterium]|nr:peptidoglycan glycosyltransferase [Clostridiaceae bacterium]